MDRLQLLGLLVGGLFQQGFHNSKYYLKLPWHPAVSFVGTTSSATSLSTTWSANEVYQQLFGDAVYFDGYNYASPSRRERACLLGATTTTPSLHTSRFPTTRLVTPSSKMTPRIYVHRSVGRGSPVILSHHLLLQIGFAHHDSSIGLVTRSPAKAPTNSHSLGGYGLDPRCYHHNHLHNPIFAHRMIW